MAVSGRLRSGVWLPPPADGTLLAWCGRPGGCREAAGLSSRFTRTRAGRRLPLLGPRGAERVAGGRTEQPKLTPRCLAGPDSEAQWKWVGPLWGSGFPGGSELAGCRAPLCTHLGALSAAASWPRSSRAPCPQTDAAAAAAAAAGPGGREGQGERAPPPSGIARRAPPARGAPQRARGSCPAAAPAVAVPAAAPPAAAAASVPAAASAAATATTRFAASGTACDAEAASDAAGAGRGSPRPRGPGFQRGSCWGDGSWKPGCRGTLRSPRPRQGPGSRPHRPSLVRATLPSGPSSPAALSLRRAPPQGGAHWPGLPAPRRRRLLPPPPPLPTLTAAASLQRLPRRGSSNAPVAASAAPRGAAPLPEGRAQGGSGGSRERGLLGVVVARL